MQTTTMSMRRAFLLAGLAALAVGANAHTMRRDGQITIDRAQNSPTLLIRYSGVTATLVELRMNGDSLGTREVSGSRSSGETNFTLSLSDLKEGDNDIEVRLYDRTGKLVGKDRTKISVAPREQGPVTLTAPRAGQSLMGPVEISVGLAQSLNNAYVSFFVDGNFKSVTNFPPFTYTWDTERETNGWHELEAWAITDGNDTLKSHKVRVFVNNPGGRTDRPGVFTSGTPSRNPSADVILDGTERGLRQTPVAANARIARGESAQPLTPKTFAGLVAMTSPSHLTLAGAASTKPIHLDEAIASGPKLLTPTGQRNLVARKPVAKIAAVPSVKSTPQRLTVQTPKKVATLKITPHASGISAGVTNALASASTMLPVTRGTRLPNLGTFTVVLDSHIVDFDVAPRVDEGVPMTPLRYLLEKSGGEVGWEHAAKRVLAKADGHEISLHIGDRFAKVGGLSLGLERAAYLDHDRTIVPLSFFRDALKVNVEYDKETGHVLITSAHK